MDGLDLTITSFIKKQLLRFGYVVQRSNFYSREDLRLMSFFKEHDVDTVLDVGANRGDYATQLLDAGFQGKIYSFEALPEMHEQLKRRAEARSDNWTIAPNSAISDKVGSATFYVTNAASSSSLLRPNDELPQMSSIMTVRETIVVPTTTISNLVHSLGISSERIFLKLDIQGGEEAALRGAEPILSQCIGMVVEMPIVEYYTGQALARTLDTWIVSQGYELWDISPAWRNPSTGRLDYVDAIYFRSMS
jgi:FkbM family methyltransferase